MGWDRPAPALCLPPWGHLAVHGGRVSEMYTSWALAWEGDGVRKKQEHKAWKPQGESQAVIFFPTGSPVMGLRRGSVRGSGHGGSREVTFIKYPFYFVPLAIH